MIDAMCNCCITDEVATEIIDRLRCNEDTVDFDCERFDRDTRKWMMNK